ncbi:phytanoyl-CoA dioxygenase family protein [Aspergillus arachidicola]|uniref:Phytanoyl-CoA dioxygenase family protein n=1 Tax=Aspergillus arachidicola TaxID=656916 RepID=A0A2G7EMS8_9EURO|nr:phytanoyl-CoA dioxygenase family protein [Aspergillus arachidicola]
MTVPNGSHKTVPSRLFQIETPNLEDFKKICSQTTDKSTYPLATSIDHNIPIYDARTLDLQNTSLTTTLQDEWYHILSTGPGILVLKGMYDPTQYTETLNTTNRAFTSIITRERASSTKKGDHFAASGKNDRIWNSFSKHALEDPSSFINYYSNPWLRLVSETWLGPAYRVTAQVNVVKPGGAARTATAIIISASRICRPGAVAHSDMPLQSGPTRFLPFSQTYEPGYLAWRREDFRAFFQEKYVALPLEFGDGLFFNPAVFHAAGANETEPTPDGGFHRKANLLQISSGLGKAMESIDVVPIVERCWGTLLERFKHAGEVDGGLENFVKAVADGYPFPTNLDKRPPAPNGMAPESEQDIMVRGLREGWGTERAVEELRKMRADSWA